MAGFPTGLNAPAGLGGPIEPSIPLDDNTQPYDTSRLPIAPEPVPSIEDTINEPDIQKMPAWLQTPLAVLRQDNREADDYAKTGGFWGKLNAIQNLPMNYLEQIPLKIAQGAEEFGNTIEWLKGTPENETHYMSTISKSIAPTDAVGNLIGTAAQFTAPFGLFNKGLTVGRTLITGLDDAAVAGMSFLPRAGIVASESAIAGGATMGIAFDPNDPDLANALHNDKSDTLTQHILQYLSTNPNDPEGVNRLKQAVVGGSIGIPFDMLMNGISHGFTARVPDKVTSNPGMLTDASEEAALGSLRGKINFGLQDHSLPTVRFSMSDWFKDQYHLKLAQIFDENYGQILMARDTDPILGKWNSWNVMSTADRAGTMADIWANRGTISKETFTTVYNKSTRTWQVESSEGGLLPTTYGGNSGQVDAEVARDKYNTFAEYKVTGRPGLAKTLEPALQSGERQNFFMYIAAQRAIKLHERGIKTDLTDEEIDAAIKNGENYSFNYKGQDYTYDQIADQLQVYNQDLLNFARQHGVISQKTMDTFLDAGPFVPFYRIFAEDTTDMPGRALITGKDPTAFKKMYGSDAGYMMEDPLVSLMNNTATILEQSINNDARRSWADKIDDLNALGYHDLANKYGSIVQNPAIGTKVPLKDIQKRLLDQGVQINLNGVDPDTLMTFWNRGRMQLGKNTEVVYRNGKATVYQIEDPLLAISIASLGPSLALDLPTSFLKAGSMFKRVVTEGSTVIPTFVAKNLTRDTQMAVVTNKSGLNWSPFDAIAKLTKDNWEHDPDYTEYLANGGGYNLYWEDSAKGNYDKFMSYYEGKGFNSAQVYNDPRDLLRIFGNVLNKNIREPWMKGIGIAETAPRFGEYLGQVQKGISKREAAADANEITVNFNRDGAAKIIKTMNATIPFFRAGLAGMYRMGHLIGTPEGRQLAALRFGAAILAPTLYFWAQNHTDERYQSLPEYVRDTNNVIIPDRLPGWNAIVSMLPKSFTDGLNNSKFPGIILIPRDFNMGTIQSIAERGLDHLFSTEPNASAFQFAPHDGMEMFGQAGDILWNAFHMNIEPAILAPIIDLAMNKNFLGGPIETDQQQQLAPYARTDAYTSPTATALGQLANISPKQLEYLWDGYTSSVGKFLLESIDSYVRPDKMGAIPSKRWDELPIIGGFLKQDPYKVTQDQMDFYNTLPKVKQSEATLRAFSNAPEGIGNMDLNDFLSVKRNIYQGAAAPQLFNAGSAGVKILNDQMKRVISDGRLTSDEKREQMDDLYEMRADMFTKIMDIVRNDPDLRSALLPNKSAQ